MAKIGFPCVIKHTNTIPEAHARKLSLAEMKALQYNDIVYTPALCGCLLRAKINGQPKTWKRQPRRVEIPFKYGMYEYGYFREFDSLYVPKG